MSKERKTTKQVAFPETGRDKESLLEEMRQLKANDANWLDARTFSYVYFPGDDIAQLVKDAYNIYFSENALNPSAFPSLKKFETEVVSMCANLFNGPEATGSLTSGGTESILLCVKTAREWAKKHKPNISVPEVVLPTTAHPAFQKAFHYFGLKQKLVPVGDDYRVDVAQMEAAISPNTVMLVGSAPAYPQGVVDPIEDIAALATKNNLLCHVDSCVGGFMLPFARRLGHPIPPYDFAVEGVTSISADIHKYGYAAKGASVVLYRNNALRRFQFYIYTGWSGGIYASPGVTGTRPGGPIAAAWAAINYLGWDGYLKLAERAMDATNQLREGIEKIEGLKILGKPDMSILCIGSDKLDIYSVGDEMSVKGWNIDRQQHPASLHLTVTQNHLKIVDEFLADLAEAVKKASKVSASSIAKNAQVFMVKGMKNILSDSMFKKVQNFAASSSKPDSKRTAAMYGMIGALKGTGALDDLVLDFIDKLNSLEEED